MDLDKLHSEKMEALESAWDAARNGQEYLPFLKTLNRCQLQEISAEKDLGINHVRIVASGPGGKTCPACRELGEKTLSLSKEMNNQSLPNPKCTCTALNKHQKGFCLCFYEPVFDDEL